MIIDISHDYIFQTYTQISMTWYKLSIYFIFSRGLTTYIQIYKTN